jgi:hypothetical protein
MPKPVALQVCDISHWVSQLNMFKHLNALLQKPSRIVLLGGNGFIDRSFVSIFLKIATGQSSTFKEVARLVANQFKNKVDFCKSPRTNSISYRRYDITNLLKAFPTFSLTMIEDGIKSYQHRSNLNG